MAQQSALTTFDNPYDPFTEFTSWYQFDMLQGYNTCGYLARVAHVSDLLSEEEVNNEVERAIDEIVRLDPLNLYCKVKRKETEKLNVS